MSSYFFLGAEENQQNKSFISSVKNYAEENQTLIYVLDKPLTDSKYSYDYEDALILLSSKHQISIINFNTSNEDNFEDFFEDVIEDLGSISDKYSYKSIVGRSRTWKGTLIQKTSYDNTSIENLLLSTEIKDDKEIKKMDLLISLFIGSINDIDRVKADVPLTLLDKVKQKIQLFDSDQTRFIYSKVDKKRIRIQGLSGTGKTELLLHKIKDIFINEPESKIGFTCHNKILANNLKNRVPQFFNFMKVEQQIEWNERLWCFNAWGSRSDVNSGLYRLICNFYGIQFYPYSNQMSFTKACQLALTEIEEKHREKNIPFAFTYLFIDESQDFDETFFSLCEYVTEKTVYIAGDVFQNIFDENISSSITPDFLLGKCYRTDPKTLMFAHALGMGLFEDKKLRWLEEKEWKDCGYNLEIQKSNYKLSREPLKRFEDLEDTFESIKIIEATESFSKSIIEQIKEIRSENDTLSPDDIGIIFLDNDQSIYENADTLEFLIKKEFKWEVSKAYKSKQKEANKVLISNRNNVKGLEFPFAICVSKKITDNHNYRNSLYTMLTRSFIKSYFITQEASKSGLTAKMREGLDYILKNQEMVIQEPSDKEKNAIRTSFQYEKKVQSLHSLLYDILSSNDIDSSCHTKALDMIQAAKIQNEDIEVLTQFIIRNRQYLDMSS